MRERHERVCVIGAGPSGLTAAKNLVDAGFVETVVFDLGKEVGGNWVFDAESGHSSVFETTHIISSREYSQYDDFPMPESYPVYPSHRQLARYFREYAEHFRLYPRIRFETWVVHCQPEDGRWRVTTVPAPEPDAPPPTSEHPDARTELFDYLVVCNGHHWKPRWPDVPGRFSGRLLHSHDFKRAAPFVDERVLVIGGGNSACDVAVETSRISRRTDLSWRRGYWIVPKFVFGLPADAIHNFVHTRMRFIPRRLRYRIAEWVLMLLNGPNSRYGLPEPDHHFGQTHPTVNSELLYAIRHGRIRPRRDLARFDGNTVHFVDGTQAEYDSVIACTGFEISHPFFDDDVIDFSEGPVRLYLRMLPADYDSLAFIGLIQPFGCIWPAAELQAKLLARYWTGEWEPPDDLEAAIDRELADPAVEQLDTPRHTITVDYPRYRRRLLGELPDDFVSLHPPRWSTPGTGSSRA